MVPQPPPGQGPIDPRAAFAPPGGAGVPPQTGAHGLPQPQRELRQPASQVSLQPAGAPAPGASSMTVPNMMSNPTPQAMPPMQPMPQMMPMGPMMPMGFPYPPPPPRRSGVGRAIFMGMLVFLLLLSGVLNLVLIGSSLGGGAGGAMTQTVKAGGGNDKIALVP